MGKTVELDDCTVELLEEYRKVYETWHELMYNEPSSNKDDDSSLIRIAISNMTDNLKDDIDFGMGNKNEGKDV